MAPVSQSGKSFWNSYSVAKLIWLAPVISRKSSMMIFRFAGRTAMATLPSRCTMTVLIGLDWIC